MSSWKAMKERLLEDEATRAAYDELEHRMRLVRAVVVARNARGWSQRDLADAAGLQQPAVARFEKADSDPRLGTVTKILHALQLQLKIDTDGIVDATEKVERTRKTAAASKPARTKKQSGGTVGSRRSPKVGDTVRVITEPTGRVSYTKRSKNGTFVEVRTERPGTFKGVRGES